MSKSKHIGIGSNSGSTHSGGVAGSLWVVGSSSGGIKGCWGHIQ